MSAANRAFEDLSPFQYRPGGSEINEIADVYKVGSDPVSVLNAPLRERVDLLEAQGHPLQAIDGRNSKLQPRPGYTASYRPTVRRQLQVRNFVPTSEPFPARDNQLTPRRKPGPAADWHIN
jgi:hypothetical protein